MSDQTLRELERGAAAGDLDAAAERLVLLHRLGRLPEERLRLAAHLEDPAAVRVADRLFGVSPRAPALLSWVRTIGHPHLDTWPRELPWRPLVQPVCVRAAVAAIDLALPVWTTPAWGAERDDEDASAQALLRVHARAQAWLLDPESPAARSGGVGLAVGTLDVVAFELTSVLAQPVAPGATLAHSRERDTARSAADVIEAAQRALVWEGAKRKRVDARLRDAIRAATVPWVLAP